MEIRWVKSSSPKKLSSSATARRTSASSVRPPTASTVPEGRLIAARTLAPRSGTARARTGAPRRGRTPPPGPGCRAGPRPVADHEYPPPRLRHRAPEALVAPGAVDPRREELARLGRGLRAALLVEPERLVEVRVQAAVVDQPGLEHGVPGPAARVDPGGGLLVGRLGCLAVELARCRARARRRSRPWPPPRAAAARPRRAGRPRGRRPAATRAACAARTRSRTGRCRARRRAAPPPPARARARSPARRAGGP